MPQKSNTRDQPVSPIPQEQDDELEMAEDHDDFEDNEDFDDEAGADEGEDVEE